MKMLSFFREVETTDPKAPLADGEEEEELGDPVPVNKYLFPMSN